MRFAIVSDIHSNLQAWNAVLVDIRSQRIEHIICLGDVVGYGPNPVEVLQSVHANIEYLVLGNHDAVICGKMDPSLFNDEAREIIEWTRRRLAPSAVGFLGSLPLSLSASMFRCTHGDFSDPGAFNYVIDAQDAAACFGSVNERLLFTGHTHRPALFQLGPDGVARTLELGHVEIGDDSRYLVGVGAVGQPRDGDARACYCIYDGDARSVEWRRVPFDLDAYRAAVIDAGLSETAQGFLASDPRLGVRPLRELLNFSPATTPEQAVRDVVPVREMLRLRRDARKWRLLTYSFLCVSLGLAGLLGGRGWYSHHRCLRTPGTGMTAISSLTEPIDSELLRWPEAQAPTGQPLRGWDITIGNRHKQSVATDFTDGSAPRLRLSSQTADYKLVLSSPLVRVRPGMKFTFSGMVMKSTNFAGNVTFNIALTRTTNGVEETVPSFLSKTPNISRRGGWLQARQTFELPARSTSMRVEIRGGFRGDVLVGDVSLKRRE